MKTIALINGDLVPDGGSYVLFSGADKIKQDVTLALLEPYGTDPVHPRWGSILDRYIGVPLTPVTKQAVVAEVQRVLKNYVAVQSDLISADASVGVRSAYDTSDIVRQVVSIDAKNSGDAIVVTVVLTTLSNETVTISRTVIA